jgi:hypothetical protein
MARILVVLAVAVAAVSTVAYASVKKITASGAGSVKLGMTYKALRAKHLIKKIHPGCELGGPNTRSAELRAPLKGGVDFTLSSPRKVAYITITGGAAAKGVGIGATLADIKAQFPHAKVDHSTEHTFEYTAVRIPKTDGGPFEFAVSTNTHKVEIIGIPGVTACE